MRYLTSSCHVIRLILRNLHQDWINRIGRQSICNTQGINFDDQFICAALMGR